MGAGIAGSLFYALTNLFDCPEKTLNKGFPLIMTGFKWINIYFLLAYKMNSCDGFNDTRNLT